MMTTSSSFIDGTWGHHTAIGRELGEVKLAGSCDAHVGTFGSADQHHDCIVLAGIHTAVQLPFPLRETVGFEEGKNPELAA